MIIEDRLPLEFYSEDELAAMKRASLGLRLNAPKLYLLVYSLTSTKAIIIGSLDIESTTRWLIEDWESSGMTPELRLQKMGSSAELLNIYAVLAKYQYIPKNNNRLTWDKVFNWEKWMKGLFNE